MSVVVPVRDDALRLANCLSALRAQTRLPDEVIVVDNASTDASAVVASSGGARVVHCAEPGIPAAAAAGYDAARGQLILRLDADCTPPPTWVEDVVLAFRAAPGVDAVTGGARFTDGPRALRWTAVLYLGAYALACAPALGHRPLFGSDMAFRARAWHRVRDEAHRHDAELHDDLDLSFHLGRHGRVARLRSAPMGISMRPFASVRGLFRRVRRGFRTVFVHWPDDLPPRRWRTRRNRLGSGGIRA